MTKYEIVKFEIGKLELKPGDVLAVKLSKETIKNNNTIESLQQGFKRILPKGVEYIMYDKDNIELSVIKQIKD